ncbi:MAG: NusG domain II-containing protein [Mogibacterium sp.]|nr:NusG domain II-containing protein [Mogibacterium sp.]
MHRKLFTKADFILLALLVVIGVAGSVLLAAGRTAGGTVVIKVDGELYGTYPLSEDRTVTVTVGDPSAGDYNIVEIKDGAVRVTEASCKNQVCVHHAAITRSGESIICLPNRMIVTIEGRGDDIDAVSN